MANKPIPVDVATGMINEYLAYMKVAGIQKQTQYVGFTAPELIKWLEGVAGYMDELRIFIGIYPPGHENAGLLTTILWPYRNGQPAKKKLSGTFKSANGDGDGSDDGDGGGKDDIEPYNEGQNGP